MPVITTNVAANAALRYLNLNSANQSAALAKLASGSNIVQASDNAAGLAIATQLQGNIAALTQSETNAAQANSILQMADGGLSTIGNILQRMMALATEAASGNVTDTQRSADIQVEFAQLSTEINNIASGTRYSGMSLLDGTSAFSGGVNFLVGSSATDTIGVTLGTFTAGTTGLNVTGDLTVIGDASNMISTLSAAMNTLTKGRASLGAYESQFNFVAQSLSTNLQNVTAANSTIMDADVAAQKSALSSADVLTQASVAALSQAAKMPQELLTLIQS
ncbi:MAG: flagellin [Magnetospirillum sp.]|nr:flagellin [Magnetospirillum sp.]